MLARAAAAAAAARRARPVHRAASVLATAGLDADTSDLFALATDFAARELAPHSEAWDRDSHFPLPTLRAAAGAGFAALCVPPAHGGAGLSRAGAAAVFEALAGGDAPATAMLTIHNMVANTVAAHGTDEQKDEWLPKLSTMDALGCYCLTEPASGSDAASLRTTATPVAGGGWELTGEKVFISGASAAGVFLVMARAAGAPPGAAGVSAFLVDAKTPGIEVGPPERKMGWKLQPTCAVAFDRARLPPPSLLGPAGAGFKIAMAALDGGRVNIGAVSVGCAAAAVDRARAYAAGRTQFGTRVADFQATRFALADAATAVHASRLLVRAAASALDARCPTATLQAAAAKRFATDACFDAANAAMQVFGGYGYLGVYGAERAVRDLRVHSILEGTNQIMRLVIARELDRLDPVAG